jgi:ferric-dicitrate binding protein FerR (iron transport regulator)
MSAETENQTTNKTHKVVFDILAGLAAMLFLKRTNLGNHPVIASVQGEVRLSGASGERMPVNGDKWHQNERIGMVGVNSSVTFKLRDGSQLDFSNGAVALKEPSIHGCRVRLEHGVLQAAVKKHSVSAPFTFLTSEAEATVIGTKLRLVAGLHSTRLEVGEGEVRFRRLHDDKEITVKSGEYATVAPNAPFIPRAIGTNTHHEK